MVEKGTMKEFKCKNCNKTVVGYRYEKSKFCNYNCFKNFKKIIYFSICNSCGCVIDGLDKEFCSTECRYKNRKSWNKGQRKYNFNCERCGKKVSSSHNKKYCSIRCWTSSDKLLKQAIKNLNIHRKKHNMSKTPTYRVWADMKNRCYNKNIKAYYWYGNRGIKVCNSWKDSFENFYKDMGEKPNKLTLDRIDNNGNYKPDNCRWATRKEQAENRGKK